LQGLLPRESVISGVREFYQAQAGVDVLGAHLAKALDFPGGLRPEALPLGTLLVEELVTNLEPLVKRL